MKKARLPLLAALTATAALTMNSANPFLTPFSDTPHGTVPFGAIEKAHYEEAVDAAIAKGLAEIEAICDNPEAPDFANTIAALDAAGSDLGRVTNVFFNLTSAETDDEMMEIENRLVPKITEYSTAISLNPRLWQRIKAVHDTADLSALTPEEQMLLEETYQSFVRNGALLEGEDRETYRQLVTELSELTNRFGQNVLKEMNTYEIWLTKDDLDGLPESQVEAAAYAAAQKGREGEYLFTLDQPVYSAFLKYSSRRDLRERMWRLSNGRNLKGEYDNTDIIRRIANGRLALAKLFGKPTYAAYSLQRTMASEPQSVMNLLGRLSEAYRPAQQREFAEIEEFAGYKIQPWDYSYEANRLRRHKLDFDEETLRPYFPLDSVIKGVFGLADRLYGVTFREAPDIQVYHPDVKAFEVIDKDGSYMGVLYTDFFPRPGKRPGAWMTEFKGEWQDPATGQIDPSHVSLVMNFTKPTATKPSLLTPYEVQTFLHEFGHALHGLMAATKYKSLSGTNVYRDFVELPSQFNENYMRQPEFLNTFARHYETGEALPQAEIDKIVASSRFGAAYACLRQLGFGLTDMAFHSITEPLAEGFDLEAFEREAGADVAMFDAIEGSAVSPVFNHIFSGGYAAGYYSYKWAEVLDADAFSLFEENGIFDRATAQSFRDNVLSRGGTEHPATLYRRFRGQEPSIDALLRRDGLLPPLPRKGEVNVVTPGK